MAEVKYVYNDKKNNKYLRQFNIIRFDFTHVKGKIDLYVECFPIFDISCVRIMLALFKYRKKGKYALDILHSNCMPMVFVLRTRANKTLLFLCLSSLFLLSAYESIIADGEFANASRIKKMSKG